MVGSLITIFINSDGNDEQQGSEVALRSKYEDDWRNLGVIRWTYDPITATVFYYDPDKWEALQKDGQVEILKELSGRYQRIPGREGRGAREAVYHGP